MRPRLPVRLSAPLLALLLALVLCANAWATSRQEAEAAVAAAETAREAAVAAGVEIDDESAAMLEQARQLIGARGYTKAVELAAEAQRQLELLSAAGASAQEDRIAGLEGLVTGIEQRLDATGQAVKVLQDATTGDRQVLAELSERTKTGLARLDPLEQQLASVSEQAQQLDALTREQDARIENNALKLYETLMGIDASKDVLKTLNQRIDQLAQRGRPMPQRGGGGTETATGAETGTATGTGAEAEAESAAQPMQQGDATEAGLLLALVLGLAFPVGVILFEAGRPASGGGLDPGSHGLLAWLGAGLGFVAIGFGIMFGPSLGGVVGAPLHFLPELLQAGKAADLTEPLRLLAMQLPLAGAVGLIACSAVYGRLSAAGCLLAALVAGALIYPLFGHWTLAAPAAGAGAGWLTAIGFQDPGTATGLATLAGAMTLALAFGLGRDRPAAGTEPEQSRCAPAQTSSWAAAGALILWAAWLVSVLATAPDMGAVPWLALSSAAAAAGAALAVVLIGSLFPAAGGWGRRLPGGLLAGVVAASAAYAIASIVQMLLLGVTTGVLYQLAVHMRGGRLGDAADLGLIFAVAGVCGSLAPGVFGPEGLLAAGVVAGALRQSIGLMVALLLAVGAGLLLALPLRRLSWLQAARP